MENVPFIDGLPINSMVIFHSYLTVCYVFPLKMVIFHCYVSSPEGTFLGFIWRGVAFLLFYWKADLWQGFFETHQENNTSDEHKRRGLALIISHYAIMIHPWYVLLHSWWMIIPCMYHDSLVQSLFWPFNSRYSSHLPKFMGETSEVDGLINPHFGCFPWLTHEFLWIFQWYPWFLIHVYFTYTYMFHD